MSAVWSKPPFIVVQLDEAPTTDVYLRGSEIVSLVPRTKGGTAIHLRASGGLYSLKDGEVLSDNYAPVKVVNSVGHVAFAVQSCAKNVERVIEGSQR